MPGTIPLDAPQKVADPTALRALQQQYGGGRKFDDDGSCYAHIGDLSQSQRPVPPPNAMRQIHAHRQEERKQREQEKEAEEFENEMSMRVKESRTAIAPPANGHVQHRRQAQVNLEAKLIDMACSYEISGCGCAECDGCYDFVEASAQGAPVYRSASGWVLHRDRVPELQQIGEEDEEELHFGWLLSKDRKPFYGLRSEDLMIKSDGWQCFYGPPPAPQAVVKTTWLEHFQKVSGRLKEEGNVAIKAGHHQEADRLYSEALTTMEGYEEMVESSMDLKELQVALLANRAEARLRLQRYEACMSDASWCLRLDDGHVKAAVRFAKASKALGRLSQAVPFLAPLARHREVQAFFEEAEVLRSCEAEDQSSSRHLLGVHKAAVRLGEVRSRWAAEKVGAEDVSSEMSTASQALTRELKSVKLEDSQRQLGCLLRGHAVLDLATEALSSSSSPDEDEEDDWALELMTACCSVSQELPTESELRQLLQSFPRFMPKLIRRPKAALALLQPLLRHRLRENLFIADSFLELKGFSKCLQAWCHLLDDRLGNESMDGLRAAASEVILELVAQVRRLDNMEALSLALFVECFIGERVGSAVSGGFVMYSGQAVRRVVPTLLRGWTENVKVLQSLSPRLVGQLWVSLGAKLRRDAGQNVQREINAPTGKLKMEWFKLKPPQSLKKGYGAFHPEELATALMQFLVGHFKATCERGFEEDPEGIAPRHPAEEWTQDVLDRPFGWGVLVPLIVSPASVATDALQLLELLVDRHPHNEIISKRLAGLHAFMPLLSLPWPQADPVESHLSATLALPIPRRSATKILQCAMDTDLGMKVAGDHLDLCLEGVLHLLHAVLDDQQPDSLIAIVELLGQICNLGALQRLPEDTVLALLRSFVRSSHSPTRTQLAKFLRLLHSNQVSRETLQRSLESVQLNLSEEQQVRVMQEIFDARSLAGQAVAQQMARAVAAEEQCPVVLSALKDPLQMQVDGFAQALCEAFLADRTKAPRLLLLGRLARLLARSMDRADLPCQMVLADTTLEGLNTGNHNFKRVTTVLLPMPEALSQNSTFAEELFDLVVTVEPMGYLDLAEYAEHLRPHIRRREREEERKLDQVQLLCMERKERFEDARDELYSAGYYLADHDQARPKLRRTVLQAGHDLSCLALPSAEKERRKATETQQAQERKEKREAAEIAKAEQEEEEMVQKTVLQTSLFDPVLMTPEDRKLPVAYDLGIAEAELLLVWLPGNNEDEALWQAAFQKFLEIYQGDALRIIIAGRPEGPEHRAPVWHSLSDQETVGRGMEWYEMHDMPTEEAIAKAAKDPASNVSFGRPSVEELHCMQEIEVSCKQLFNLLSDEVARNQKTKVILGGFSQGGAVAAFAGLSRAAPVKVQQQLTSLLCCGCAVPGFQYLASKMQAACLQRRDSPEDSPFPSVKLIYCENDPEVSDRYVSTILSLCNRFEHPAALHSFKVEIKEQLPGGPRPIPGLPEQWLPSIMKEVLESLAFPAS